MLWETIRQSGLTVRDNILLENAGVERLMQNHGIPNGARNAIQHAKVSAWLDHWLGGTAATTLGNINEWLGTSSPEDKFKDQWNNEVGRRISDYINDNNLPWGVIDELIADAFQNGHLILDDNDSRINDPDITTTNWNVPSSNWQFLGPYPIPNPTNPNSLMPWHIPTLPESNPFPTPGNPLENPPASPLIIDLDDDGIELLSHANSTASFDLDADGFAELTGWASADDALLARDVNGNGRIDDINEIFGNATTDGFTELALLDSNSDGVIDSNDTAFSELILWQDADENGISTSTEFTTLAAAGLVSIDLNATLISEVNQGHDVTHRSTVTWSDNSTSLIEDVWFQHSQVHTRSILADSFQYNGTALSLPFLNGYGTVAHTAIALSNDSNLRQKAEDLVTLATDGQLSDFMVSFEEFMWDWAGVTAVDPASSGQFMNGRHLALVEAFYGQSFFDLHGIDPGHAQADALEEQYVAIIESSAARFLAQTSMGHILLDSNSTVADFEAHHFYDLTDLLYDPATNELGGDLSIITDLVVSHLQDSTSPLSPFDAGLLLRMMRHDFGTDQAAYNTAITTALSAASIDQATIDIVLNVVAAETPVFGTEAAETIVGTDVTTGDILDSGAGDDLIQGAYGSDTYLWRIGDGNDTIDDEGYGSNLDSDTLKLLDINAGDLSFSRMVDGSNDLSITVSTTGEIITIDEHFTSENKGIEHLVFADGTSWDRSQISLNATLVGSAAAETIYGSNNDDTIIGNGGDDTLEGEDGSDTYIYSLGDGSDTIHDDGNSAADLDVLRFGAGISANDVQGYLQNGVNYLGLDLTDGSTITVEWQFWSTPYGLDQIEFDDGTIWDAAKIKTFKTIGSDNTEGLYGDNDDNVLIGNGGDDTLEGERGSDTYIYSLGDGSDDIYDDGSSSDTDILQFEDGINPEHIIYSESGSHAAVAFTHDSAVIDLEYQNYSAAYDIDQFHFKEGTVVNKADFATRFQHGDSAANTLTGTAMADWLHGHGGNDTISGGAGDDYINGGPGDDIMTGGLADTDSFIFQDTYGHDVITDFEEGSQQSDVVKIAGLNVNTFADVLGMASQVGADTKIDFGNDTSLTLLGVDKNSLHENDFFFA